MRIDKLLSNMGYGSRNDIKKDVKAGAVTVNGKAIKSASIHVDEKNDLITYNGEKVVYREFIYLMMNKPPGVVSATFDNYDETVIDLVDEEFKIFDPHPVGRLDKDTEGLLILTNDGKLSHSLLSPKKHINKTYMAVLEKELDEKTKEAFKKGIDLGDFTSMPSEVKLADEEVINDFLNNEEIINEFLNNEEYNFQNDIKNIVSKNNSELKSKIAVVEIKEGKFHQVKRMFESCGNKVTYLKRIKMGDLSLDKNLELGEYRELSDQELEILKNS